MEVADSEVGPIDVHGEVAAGATREVLDVDVTAVLAAGDRASALLVDLLAHLVGQFLADIGALRGRGESDLGAASLVRLDEITLALVPLVKQLLRWHRADQAGVRDSCEAHAGNVPRGRIDALKVPDGLGRLGVELVREQATTVGLWASAQH